MQCAPTCVFYSFMCLENSQTWDQRLINPMYCFHCTIFYQILEASLSDYVIWEYGWGCLQYFPVSQCVHSSCSSLIAVEQLFIKNREYFCEGQSPYGYSNHNHGEGWEGWDGSRSVHNITELCWVGHTHLAEQINSGSVSFREEWGLMASWNPFEGNHSPQ